MFNRSRTTRDDDYDAGAAVLAGTVAGVLSAGTMYLEIWRSGRNLNDLMLLGRPFTGGADHAELVGFPIHLLNSAGLALLYAAFGRERLPGPPAVRGAIFTLIENAALYPLTCFEGVHPAIKDGQIDRYWSVRSHLWTVPRHVVFGLALGSLYEWLRS